MANNFTIEIPRSVPDVVNTQATKAINLITKKNSLEINDIEVINELLSLCRLACGKFSLDCMRHFETDISEHSQVNHT